MIKFFKGMKLLSKGFVFVEAMMAFLIVAFAVTALLSVFINNMFLNMANRDVTTAISHAQYALEYTKNKNFYNIVTETITTATWNNSSMTYNKLVPMDAESIVITVSEPVLYVKDVIATVNWQERGIFNRSISLETEITGQ